MSLDSKYVTKQAPMGAAATYNSIQPSPAAYGVHFLGMVTPELANTVYLYEGINAPVSPYTPVPYAFVPTPKTVAGDLSTTTGGGAAIANGTVVNIVATYINNIGETAASPVVSITVGGAGPYNVVVTAETWPTLGYGGSYQIQAENIYMSVAASTTYYYAGKITTSGGTLTIPASITTGNTAPTANTTLTDPFNFLQ